jgi:CheY-like chemotaxis protein
LENGNESSRILIVDDVPQNVQLIGTILMQKGYRVSVARNGLKAIEIVKKTIPDLILLDIMMPEMDGFETCAHLKSLEQTRDIPIIFLTAKTDMEFIVKGFELGAVDYITKPFNPSEMLARVRTHLDLKCAVETIERVCRERKEILHVLSHDLANTFLSIVSTLELIENHSDFEKLKQVLMSSAVNGIKMIEMVRDVRALEEKKLDVGPVDLWAAFQKSRILLEGMFSDKEIELSINADGQFSVMAEEVSLVNSVMNNILTNAVKFSPRGSKIDITARSDGNWVEISIRDYGIGMSEQALADLFDLTRSKSRKGTGGESGTGFGMPLVKKFVATYGGSIQVFSKEERADAIDHGTEVQLRLKAGK